MNTHWIRTTPQSLPFPFPMEARKVRVVPPLSIPSQRCDSPHGQVHYIHSTSSPPDRLRGEPGKLNGGRMSVVESRMKEGMERERATRDFHLSNVYGMAFCMNLRMRETLLQQFQRLPGPLPSSFCGLDTLQGRDDVLTFEDYLGDSTLEEGVDDLHVAMEKKLGL